MTSINSSIWENKSNWCSQDNKPEREEYKGNVGKFSYS